MKKWMLILSCLFISIGIAVAQTTQATGIVVDDTGEEIIGASIVVKGTNTGTVTDIDGKFSVSLPSGKDVLVISYVGMKTKEVKASSNMRVILASNTNLEEVVVTAMGITREEKSLGYAVSSLKSEELLKARESNVINSLAGKAAGVRVTSASGTLGGSSKVIIRGANSLDGNNQPLFVVDGMPIDNGAPGSASSNVVAGGVDTGNRAGDLNPDDIESMSILKGAAATALYGARAKNGAIIITTKKGSKSSRLSIDVNSSVRFDKVSKLPEFQNDYAEGNYGKYDASKMNGWGPRIEGQQVQDFLGNTITMQAHPDNVKDFYETGESYINSIALSGGSEAVDYRFGFTALNQSGVIPETNLNRYTFNTNVGYTFSKKLSARSILSYYSTSIHGRPSQSSNDPNVLASVVNGLPRTMDINKLRNNWVDRYGAQIPMNTSKKDNNPYWILNKNRFTSYLERVVASQSITYKPFEWLTFSNNLGLDTYSERRRQVTGKTTLGEKEGAYIDDNFTNQVINNDFIATLTKTLTPDLDLKVIAGHNLYQSTYTRDRLVARGLIVDGLYNPANASSTSPTARYERKRMTGVYADFGLSYRNFLYFNATGRNDWSSTLPKNNRSYFYPSLSTSFVFSELLEDKGILSFGNLRLNWANVGSDEKPYQVGFNYAPASTYYAQFSLSGTFPNSGLSGFSIPRIYPNLDLKPQNQQSFEIGTNLKFFNNRIGVDFTFYNIKTTDQIIAIDVPLSTGYFAKNMNVGEVRNRGFEMTLNLVPVKTRDFEWNLDLNYSTNKQKIIELDKNNPELKYNLASGWSGLQIQAEKGHPFGLYGTAWKRNENGDILIDKKTGLREIVTGERLGDTDPKWTMGINNSFNYKGFNLSFLIDIRQGGVIYSGTVATLRNSGLAKETAGFDRTDVKSYVDEGVVRNSDGSYSPNTTAITPQAYWEHVAKVSNTEGAVFDASYIKLREIRLGYTLPKVFVSKFLLRSAEIAFEARNLWIIKDHVPHIDPEVSLYGVNSAGDGVEFNSVPSTKSFGVNLRLGF